MNDEPFSWHKTPRQITVWVCPRCGYWRDQKSTGVHQAFIGDGLPEVHRLQKATYYLAAIEPKRTPASRGSSKDS